MSTEPERCSRCNAQVPERRSAIVLSCPRVGCPVPGVELSLRPALLRLLAAGWSIDLQQHADSSGRRGAPAEPEYPRVFSVFIRRFDASGTRSVFGTGRRGELDDALRDAVRGAAEDARRQQLTEIAAELEDA